MAAAAAATERRHEVKLHRLAALRHLRDLEKVKGAAQAAVVLLRFCANAIPNFSLRSSLPAVSAPTAALHDDRIAAALGEVLAITADPAPAIARATAAARLPIVMGGLGLPPASAIASVAYCASMISALSTVRRLVPFLAAATAPTAASPLPSPQIYNLCYNGCNNTLVL